jgi:hypothetical protein
VESLCGFDLHFLISSFEKFCLVQTVDSQKLTSLSRFLSPQYLQLLKFLINTFPLENASILFLLL